MSKRGEGRRSGSLFFRCCILLGLVAIAPPLRAQSTSAEDRDRVALIERVSRSVVWVRTIAEDPPAPTPPAKTRTKPPAFDVSDFQRIFRGGQPKREEGSGFVIDGERGLILTAAHLVDRSKTVTVGLPGGGEVPAQIVGIDQDGGFALLRVMGAKLPPLQFAARDAKAGESAMVVGWMIPLKSVMPIEGMVMGPAPGAAQHAAASLLADYVALDAIIPNGGFGGSPVVDRSGAVIGFVSAILGRDYGTAAVTLMIPARGLRPLVEELAANGRIRRGGIGAAVDCARLPCVIDSIARGSPAELAGLKIGNAIVAVDGARLESESQLHRAVAIRPVGSDVTLTVTISGRQSTLVTKTAPQP